MMEPPQRARALPPRGRKYRTVANQLKSQVVSARWPIGSRLPPDHELARQHGVGLNTIRFALAELVRDGLIVRRHGSGSFVNDHRSIGRSRTQLGLLVPTLRGRFLDLIAGVEEVASSHGVDLRLLSFEDGLDRETDHISELVRGGSSGAIVMPALHLSPDPDVYQRFLADLPIPVILAERHPSREFSDRLSAARTDVVHGTYAAVAHLVHSGRQRIGLLSSRAGGTSDDVYVGYLMAVRDFDLPFNPGAVARRMHWRDRDLRDFASIVRAEEVDGLICLSDTFAARLLSHLRRQGIRTPDDLAIVAYEDRIARYADVPLTAIRPQRHEVGMTAMRMLLQRLQSPLATPVMQVNIQPTLIVRASTAGH